jgi:hypothetical protein
MHLAEESLLGELIMGGRLDFNKAFRNVQAQYGLSVKDEAEWMENDAALRGGWQEMRTGLRKRPTIVPQLNDAPLVT